MLETYLPWHFSTNISTYGISCSTSHHLLSPLCWSGMHFHHYVAEIWLNTSLFTFSCSPAFSSVVSVASVGASSFASCVAGAGSHYMTLPTFSCSPAFSSVVSVASVGASSFASCVAGAGSAAFSSSGSLASITGGSLVGDDISLATRSSSAW